MFLTPMSPPSGEAVRLGSLLIDAERLRTPGDSLRPLLASLPLEFAKVRAALNELPIDGWRPVHAEDHPATGVRLVLAAPHPEVDDAWCIFDLSGCGESWTFTTEQGPIRAEPVSN